MGTDDGWKKLWHRLQHQFQVGLSWIISGLVETVYLVLWVLMQWSFGRFLALLPIPYDNKWELDALRALFALSTLIMIIFSIYADMRRAWYEARDFVAEPQSSSRPSSVAPDPIRGLKRKPLSLPKERLHRTVTWAFSLALIIGINVVGAALVGALTRTIWGTASYLVSVICFSYLFLSASRARVPVECVGLTKLRRQPRLIWGPITYYAWPIVEDWIGIIPLDTFCFDSELYQVVIVDGTLAVRIRACCRISRNGELGGNVLNAVEATSCFRRRAVRKLFAPGRGLSIEATREAFNRRLSADLRDSILEISLGKTSQAIAENLDGTQMRVRIALSEKVEQWGLEIVDVKLLELGKLSARGT